MPRTRKRTSPDRPALDSEVTREGRVRVNGTDHDVSRAGVEYVSALLDDIADRAVTGDVDDDEWQRADEGMAYVRRARLIEQAEATIARGGGERGDYVPPDGVHGNYSDGRDAWRVDLRQLAPRFLVDRARRAIAATHARRPEGVPDVAYERATELVSSPIAAEATRAAQWAIATSDPAYEVAFAKMVRDPQRGHLEWSETERQAYQRVQDVARAMALSPDSAGGFMVPFTLDPAVLLTSDGSVNPLRQVARVVQTTTEAWHGVSSAGVTAAWYAEAAEVADHSPTLGQPSIPVHKGMAFVPYSFEVEGDAVDLLGQLRDLLVDGADQLMAEAYTVGTGNAQPTGIVTALLGTASEVPPATAETFDPVADVLATIEAVPPRFRPRARWQANLSTLNTLEQAETTNGAKFYPGLDSPTPTVLRKPVDENSNMRGTSDINPAQTANNGVLLAGDFAAGFVIADRVGTTLELVPHLFGAARRPTGQRGALMWFRTGSDVVVPNALRVLNVETTAP